MAMQSASNVYFARVRGGIILEMGWTDPGAFRMMQDSSDEYVEITREQYDTLNLDEPLE